MEASYMESADAIVEYIRVLSDKKEEADVDADKLLSEINISLFGRKEAAPKNENSPARENKKEKGKNEDIEMEELKRSIEIREELKNRIDAVIESSKTTDIRINRCAGDLRESLNGSRLYKKSCPDAEHILERYKKSISDLSIFWNEYEGYLLLGR